MSQEKRDLLDWLVLRAPAIGTAISAGTVRLKLGLAAEETGDVGGDPAGL